MSERMAALKPRHSEVDETEPSVLIIEWIDPLMAAGHWIPALVEIAVGINLITQEGSPSPYITWAEIAEANPDTIVVAPCGFSLERTEHEMKAITTQPEWQDLRAVQSNRVAITDGNRFINRPSPNVVESAAMLSDIIHHGAPHDGPPAWRWFAQFYLIRLQ